MSDQQVASYVQRVQRLQEEKRTIEDDIKEVYAEARANGYDVKVLRAVVKHLGKDENEVAEFDAIFDLYLQAVKNALAGAGAGRATHVREERPASPDLSPAAQNEGIDEGGDNLTADRLREILSYDPESGEFRWLQLPPMALRAKVGDRAGRVQNHGYRTIRIAGKDHVEHRLAWLYSFGEWPVSHLDHINGDKADNRIANLREATASQNMANRPVSARNRSGHKGVSWAADRQAWMAFITVEGRGRFLGYFDNKELAASAYEAAAEKAHGEFAVHNRPAEPAPAADARPIFGGRQPKPLRPHCKNPHNCAGYGSKHCFRCAQASEAA